VSTRAIRSLATNDGSNQAEERAGSFPVGPDHDGGPRQARFGAVRFGGYVILVEGRGIAPMPFAAFAELPDVGVSGLAESHAVPRQCIQQRVGDRTNLTRHDIETKFRQGRGLFCFHKRLLAPSA
jgi:hypothetical protein